MVLVEICGVAAVAMKASVHGGRKEGRHLFWLREQLGDSLVLLFARAHGPLGPRPRSTLCEIRRELRPIRSAF